MKKKSVLYQADYKFHRPAVKDLKDGELKEAYRYTKIFLTM